MWLVWYGMVYRLRTTILEKEVDNWNQWKVLIGESLPHSIVTVLMLGRSKIIDTF